MVRPSRRQLRVVFTLVLVVSVGMVASNYVTAKTNIAKTQSDSNTLQLEQRINGSNVAVTGKATKNLTVVATQGFYVSDEQAELVAFNENGEVVYYDDTYRVYFDVDQVPNKQHTVEYLASKHHKGDECSKVSTNRCTYNVFKRVNLSTGKSRELYGEVTPRILSGRWHDVDRYNESHVVIADIVQDSVRIMNRTSGETTWRWNATRIYNKSQGGQPGDWTHVNDVEVLQDGRIMASMRNMDQVIFLEPGNGANESWTLGEENNYSILYEQHNPDYIPKERGGPAIIVSDSENDRVLEFQRVNGSWERTWGWRDSRLKWPRDADRLPNNNTLIVDTHGDRIVEVTPSGKVVWNVTIGMPYDVERLGTGDESTGGYSMRAIRDQRATGEIVTPGGPFAGFWITLKDYMPSLIVNGILFAAPSWFRFSDLVFSIVFLIGLVSWSSLEIYWSQYSPVKYVRSLPARIRSQ